MNKISRKVKVVDVKVEYAYFDSEESVLKTDVAYLKAVPYTKKIKDFNENVLYFLRRICECEIETMLNVIQKDYILECKMDLCEFVEISEISVKED